MVLLQLYSKSEIIKNKLLTHDLWMAAGYNGKTNELRIKRREFELYLLTIYTFLFMGQVH